jgi:hypothetical protein
VLTVKTPIVWLTIGCGARGTVWQIMLEAVKNAGEVARAPYHLNAPANYKGSIPISGFIELTLRYEPFVEVSVSCYPTLGFVSSFLTCLSQRRRGTISIQLVTLQFHHVTISSRYNFITLQFMTLQFRYVSVSYQFHHVIVSSRCSFIPA